MCLLLKLWVKEMQLISKEWSIRRKMMICYFLSMFAVISIILVLVVVTFSYIHNQSIKRIEQTVDTQASQNMQALVKQGATLIIAQLSSVNLMLGYLREMVYIMNDEQQFAIQRKKLYTYQNADTNVCYPNSFQYQLSYVCTYYKSITSEYNQDWLQRIGRLSYFLPLIFQQYNDLVIRFWLLFQDFGFHIVYPGILVTDQYYQNSKSEWEQAQNYLMITKPMPDFLGNDQKSIFSLIGPLVNENYEISGIIRADLSIAGLFDKVLEMEYLDDSIVALVYKDGQIIEYGTPDAPQNGKKITEVANESFWESILKKPNGIHNMIKDDTIYRVASSKVQLNLDKEDYWFILMLIQREKQIQRYKTEAEQDLNRIAFVYLGATGIFAFLTILVILCLSSQLAKSITRPLTGLIEFSNKISDGAHNRQSLTEELDNLIVGQDQVAHLVEAYKYMANTLLSKNDERSSYPFQNSDQDIFPPNQYWRTDKLAWLKEISEKMKKDQ